MSHRLTPIVEVQQVASEDFCESCPKEDDAVRSMIIDDPNKMVVVPSYILRSRKNSRRGYHFLLCRRCAVALAVDILEREVG